MGKCLSCCDQSDEPTQNGHPQQPQELTKMPSATQSITAKSYLTEPKALPLGIETKSIQMITNGDKRPAFPQYPKLPPIRKSSNTDSKRLSLTPRNEYSESKISSLFEMYKDPNVDAILAEGIEKFCSDLNVKPEEFKVLVLAWKFDAETMCRFTRTEFITGCKKLKVDSIKGIQSKFPEMLSEVQDKQIFKDLYKWTYKFCLDSDIGQRTLPVDMATTMWPLVFTQYEPPTLKRWLEFLDRHPSVRGISKDTWDMFLNFTEHVGHDLTNYDDTEAWPSLFDDFVEYENDRKNQNVQEKEELY